MKLTLAILAALATAAPAFAEGDAVKGAAVFKQCQACHVVVDPDGNVLAGKASKTGPNLYAVIGRVAGSYPEFKYGESMIAAGAAGLVWDETTFVAYVQDPQAFLKERLADKSAKGKMVFKVKNAEAAADVYAYLVSLAPIVDPAVAPAAPVAN